MSLILIMGLPAAGKSTVASKLHEHHPNSIVFSLDDMNGRWSNEFEAHRDRKSFEQTVRSYLEEKCHSEFEAWVIVDDNFYLKSMRRPFKRMANAFGLHYHCLLVDCNLQDALWRNSGRGHDRVSDQTVMKMAQEMEVPEDALTYRGQALEEIIRFLTQPRPRRVLSKQESSSQSSHSILSEVDQFLRIAVSEAVHEGMDGRMLASAKKAVMDRCKRSKSAFSKNEIRKLLLDEYIATKQHRENEESQ